MTLGLSAAGIYPDHLYELNGYCCETLRHNKENGALIAGDIHESDIRSVDWTKLNSSVRVLSGGPPCQPFSLAGKHLADRDDRNEFPSTLQAVRLLRPEIIILENVPGLSRESFRPYLDYVVRQLEHPALCPIPGELWQDHDRRIRKYQRCGQEPIYRVAWKILNAADFGMAQVRARIFIIATKAALPVFEFPEPTYSRAALVRSQKSGAYWRERGLKAPRERVFPRGSLWYRGERAEELLPWRTVRDVLSDLPDPKAGEVDDLLHRFIPGARLYDKHNGSELDWPSKTIKAGVHGVAGGENVLRINRQRFRYFTLREMARLQGFPDSYVFKGPRSRIIGQIGNAVPSGLVKAIGLKVRKLVESEASAARKIV